MSKFILPTPFTWLDALLDPRPQATRKYNRRLVHSALDNIANQVEWNAERNFAGVRNLDYQRGYFDLFPALHARYALSDRTNLRLALTQTIARPNYRAMSPYRVVSYDSEELRIGNPELVSMRSSNIDLLFERYFGIWRRAGSVFGRLQFIDMIP